MNEIRGVRPRKVSVAVEVALGPHDDDPKVSTSKGDATVGHMANLGPGSWTYLTY